ncbi:hypothetical protein [Streptomyces sp. CA-111067]|uniref:hypothetical protein n=1 Tax=Streptomyces sp. CA-111067 TaxID=3240046 RepID=UPI003D995416
MTATGRAVAYGYMRVPRAMEDEEIQVIERRMEEYAVSQQLEIMATHYEYGDGTTNVSDLVYFLRRNNAEHVIVPSMEQITDHLVIQSIVTTAIVDGIGATLHEASEESPSG